jgi:hypothetical protein
LILTLRPRTLVIVWFTTYRTCGQRSDIRQPGNILLLFLHLILGCPEEIEHTMKWLSSSSLRLEYHWEVESIKSREYVLHWTRPSLKRIGGNSWGGIHNQTEHSSRRVHWNTDFFSQCVVFSAWWFFDRIVSVLDWSHHPANSYWTIDKLYEYSKMWVAVHSSA